MNGFNGEETSPNPLNNRYLNGLSQKLQFYLDKTTPHATARWAGLAAFVTLYAIRVFFLQVSIILLKSDNDVL